MTLKRVLFFIILLLGLVDNSAIGGDDDLTTIVVTGQRGGGMLPPITVIGRRPGRGNSLEPGDGQTSNPDNGPQGFPIRVICSYVTALKKYYLKDCDPNNPKNIGTFSLAQRDRSATKPFMDYVNFAPNVAALANGCGPADKWYSRGIPDSIPGGYNFKPACDAHDVCYGSARLEKRQCDANFSDSLTNVCNGSSYCQKVADEYVKAVRDYGQDSYDTAFAEYHCAEFSFLKNTYVKWTCPI